VLGGRDNVLLLLLFDTSVIFTSSPLPDAARRRALVLPDWGALEVGAAPLAGTALVFNALTGGAVPALATPNPPTPMPMPMLLEVAVMRVKDERFASPTDSAPAYGSIPLEYGEAGTEVWPGRREDEEAGGTTAGAFDRSTNLDALDCPLFGSSSSLVGRLSDPWVARAEGAMAALLSVTGGFGSIEAGIVADIVS